MEIEYTLEADIKREDALNNNYTVCSQTVTLDDESGYTEEQLELLLTEQIGLTLGSVTDIFGVKDTTAPDFTP